MTGIFKGIQGLISNIQTIINAIKLFWQFELSLIKSIYELLQLIGTTITNVTTLIATLPSWLIAIATATIGVSVLYLIVGRNTGK